MLPVKGKYPKYACGIAEMVPFLKEIKDHPLSDHPFVKYVNYLSMLLL